MKKIFTFLAVSGMMFGAAKAQIVTISPANATGDQAITITLDANAACVPAGKLAVTNAAATGVHMHSGVGIEADINGPDGKWQNVVAWDEPGTQLTAGANGIYTITLTPRSFYTVDATETIYRLSMVFNGGSWDYEAKNTTATAGECADFFIELSTATSVAEQALELNSVKAYPNPFNESTTVSFTTLRNANVKINVFNILGQEVATLANKQMESGKHFVKWDGAGKGGEFMPNGQYFIQVSVDGVVSTARVVLNR
jgi:hypothetical protein